MMELDIEFEDIPKLNRTPPPGRVAFDWSHALHPLRENMGKSARVVTFGGDEKSKAQAQAKSQQIRNYMYTNCHDEHWDVKTRERDGRYGVYVTYFGKLTIDQQKKRDELREERRASILAGRARAALVDDE